MVAKMTGRDLVLLTLLGFGAITNAAVCTKDQVDYNPFACGSFLDQNLCSIFQSNCPITCSLCTAPPPEVKAVDKTDCLQAHNDKRFLHGVPNLAWDDALAKSAEDYALSLANKSKDVPDGGTIFIGHSYELGVGKDYGENIFWSKVNFTVGHTCKDAVNAWYKEIVDYDYDTGKAKTEGKMIGHFTQVVWLGTTKVGVGIAVHRGIRFVRTFVVAHYTPPGNTVGEYQTNVPVPIYE